ncbi:MAG: outer membrane protein transport protein [Rhodothermia bacterium]|nr:outer membrane protein transport protein [Rhodothermia bacterium]
MKTANWVSAIIALTIAAVPGSANAQDGEDALRFTQRQPSVGVRALGFGGAGIGGVADLSAINTNPAGLAYLRRSLFSGSLTSFNTTDDAAFSVAGTRSVVENDVTDTGLDHIAYAYRAPTRRGSMVVTAGVSRVQTFSRELFFTGDNGVNSATEFFLPLPSEFEVEVGSGDDGVRGTDDDVYTPLFSRPLSFIGFETFAIDLDIDAFEAGEEVPFFPAVTTGTVRQTGVVLEEGNMHEFSFGGAFEASKGVMVGATVNIPYGKWEFTSTLEEVDINDDNDGSGFTIDFDNLTWTETVESRLVGVNLRAGVSLEAARDLRVGFTVETPTYYSVSEDFATFLETGFDNGDAFSYGFDFGESEGSGSFDYEILTPWKLGAGLVFRTGNLRLLADAEFVDWSQLELDADGFDFVQENQDISQNLEQVVNTRIGAEYVLGNFVVRGGLGFRPDPRDIRPDLQSEATGVDRDRTYVSAGFSYVRDRQFAIDFALSQERFDDRYTPYNVVGAPVVDEEISRGRASLGVRIFL